MLQRRDGERVSDLAELDLLSPMESGFLSRKSGFICIASREEDGSNLGDSKKPRQPHVPRDCGTLVDGE